MMGGWSWAEGRGRADGRRCRQSSDTIVDLGQLRQTCFYCHSESFLIPTLEHVDRSQAAGEAERLAVIRQAVRKQRRGWRVGAMGWSGRKSSEETMSISNGVPRAWQCSNCLAWNRRDSKGEIMDSDPTMASSSTSAGFCVRRETFSSSHIGTVNVEESTLFCQQCLANQNLVIHLLANYLPDEHDPEYDKAQRELSRYQDSIMQRYPVVCEHCQPAVDAAIRSADYKAKASMLATTLRATGESKGQKVKAKRHRGARLLDLAAFSTDMGIGVGFFGVKRGLLWHSRAKNLEDHLLTKQGHVTTILQMLLWLLCSMHLGRRFILSSTGMTGLTFSVILLTIIVKSVFGTLYMTNQEASSINLVSVMDTLGIVCMTMSLVAWLPLTVKAFHAGDRHKAVTMTIWAGTNAVGRAAPDRDSDKMTRVTAPRDRLDDPQSTATAGEGDPMDWHATEKTPDNKPSWPTAVQRNFFAFERPTGLESVFEQVLSFQDHKTETALAQRARRGLLMLLLTIICRGILCAMLLISSRESSAHWLQAAILGLSTLSAVSGWHSCRALYQAMTTIKMVLVIMHCIVVHLNQTVSPIGIVSRHLQAGKLLPSLVIALEVAVSIGQAGAITQSVK